MPRIKKVDAIIQARLTSSRFPNKVNTFLGKKTVLSWVIESLQKCKNIDQIILAIPDNPENMDLLEYEHLYKIKIFAGDEDNVLDRFIGAAEFYGTENILRVCADSPFLPTWLIDYAIEVWNPKKYGYLVSHDMPMGQNIELITLEALKVLSQHADVAEQEHVTLGFYRTSNLIYPIEKIAELGISLTVDVPSDLKSLDGMAKYYE